MAPLVTLVCSLRDSTVVLHWNQGRQFVANRVRKIGEHAIDEWRHVPIAQNRSNLDQICQNSEEKL